MLFKKKTTKPETTAQAENAEPEQKFQKDIKVLWIYTTLFCLSAILLIVISSLIQKKINSTADYYQGLYEGEKTSSQSTIKNIQTENTAFKTENAALREENKELSDRINASTDTINTASELAESYEYIILAQKETYTGSKSKARAHLEKVNPDILAGDMLNLYERLCNTLGV